MIGGFSDANQQSFDGNQHHTSQALTLFVGCLDPQTTKDDLTAYFRNFDPWIKTKLIINFKTGQSKQCGLLFCSSFETMNKILGEEHFLHHRRVRVNPGQNEFKGTKINDLYQVQISGLDPDISLDALNEVFMKYQGFVKVRLVQGLHPKQKKVAILYFDDHASAQAVLEHSHIQVGHRNCKVSPYYKDTNSYLPPPNFGHSPEVGIRNSCPTFGKEVSGSNSLRHQFQLDDTPKTQASDNSINKQRPLSPLRLGPMESFINYSNTGQDKQKAASQAFVHPVEAEKDALYRIFCDLPLPPQFEKKEDPQLKISSESKETRDE